MDGSLHNRRFLQENLMSMTLEMPQQLMSPTTAVRQQLERCFEEFFFHFFYLDTWFGENFVARFEYDRLHCKLVLRLLTRRLQPVLDDACGIRVQCLAPRYGPIVFGDSIINSAGTCTFYLRREVDEALRFALVP